MTKAFLWSASYSDLTLTTPALRSWEEMPGAAVNAAAVKTDTDGVSIARQGRTQS